MSDVIDRIKQKYPQYAEIPDDQLTLKIAEKYPQYLEKDPQFKEDYQNGVASTVAAGIGMGLQNVSQLMGTLANPAAGEAAQAGAQQNDMERAGAIAAGINMGQQAVSKVVSTLNNPAAGAAAAAGREPPPAEPTDQLRAPTVFERFRFGPIGQALLGKTSLERDLENKGAMGPIEGLTHSIKLLDLKPVDIVEAARQFTAAQLGVRPDQLAPKPTEESVAAAMQQSRTAGLSIGVVKGLEDLDNFFTSPLGVGTLGTAYLPKLAARMVALGFAAQMASQTPEIARQLGDELGKPEDQRDYQKIGNLTVQAASTIGFSVAGVLHGAGPGIRGDAAADVRRAAASIRSVAPQTARALRSSARFIEGPDFEQPPSEKGTDALHGEAKEVLQPVQPQPGQGQGEVSGQGAGAETGARSQPAIPEKTQQAVDFDRYQELQAQFKGKTLDELEGMTAQRQEIEQIKRRYGGFPPQPVEQITHAAVLDEEGNPRLGANHPEILERMGVEGFDTRESRNEPQFGFWTNRGRFVSREQAGQIATEAGQNLEQFDPAEKVHSDQIRSRIDPSQTLGNAPEETYPVPEPLSPPVIQAGAAHITEIPETGAGMEKYGVSQEVREERAKAGQVVLVQPGRGLDVADSIEHGRAILAQDPTAAERMLQQFEADPQKKIWDDLIAVTRAHGEVLAQHETRMEVAHGTDSPEWREAKAALDAWDLRTKPPQTEWHRIGKTQQGWTDLDTGSVGGLERERKRTTGEDFTEPERKKAGEIAEEVRNEKASTDEAAAKVETEIQNTEPSPEKQLEKEEKQLSDFTSDSNTSADMEAAAQKAIDSANQVVRENAIRGATKENKARVAQAKRDVEVAKIQREAARKAKEAADKAIRKQAVQVAKAARKVEVRTELKDQAKAANDALLAAHKTVREAAVRLAEAENKAREAAAGDAKKVADIQAKAAKKAQDAAWKTVREAAQRRAALERKLVGDGSIAVWEKARQYLQAYDENGRAVPSSISFDDLRNKIAADLGMPIEQVTRLLARSKRMKFLTDDLWLKQQRERNAKTKAKLWVEGLDTPEYEKWIKSVPRILFKIRVGLHGTVALGTHAPAVAFDPRFWTTYARNFGKMYHLVLSRTFYEAQMQGLVRRKNFAVGKHAGLINDPYKYEEFSHPGITEDIAKNIKDSIAKATGIDPRWFTKAGDRGYSILKVLRQDMFDQHWDNLPRQMQTSEMAKAIADAVNHITGVVQTPAPFHAEMVAFAPKLLMSRFAFLFGDPMRAGQTGLRAAVGVGMKVAGYEGKLPQLTDAEKWFAINEAKTKIYTGATLLGLLALNQGVLAAAGSKQKVNWSNPFKSDFGKFKVAGYNVSYGGALLTAARLPIRLGALGIGSGGKLGKLIYPDENAAKMVWDYFRSQLSPAAAFAADMVWREDWQGRQMWFSDRTEPKRLQAQGIQPYTPKEYLTELGLMIPLQEMYRETLKNGFGLNWDTAKGAAVAALMAGTGARISQDANAEHAQQ